MASPPLRGSAEWSAKREVEVLLLLTGEALPADKSRSALEGGGRGTDYLEFDRRNTFPDYSVRCRA